MEEGELDLCTVDRIDRNVVFVKMSDGQEGTIVSSEIASGRIKNMREYVVPNKKVVCKILKISGNHIELSLRRVGSKEKQEVMQKFKIEQTLNASFKQTLGEDFNKVRLKILEEFQSLSDFVHAVREDNSILGTFVPKENVDSLLKAIEKRRKKSVIYVKLALKCFGEKGISNIREILNIGDEDTKITYISAGNYRLTIMTEDFKKGKKRLMELTEIMQDKAMKNNCEFSFEEEK